ncbi:MAG: hypothetical protein Q8O37_03565 [Sulfuricellaceae bacterium]|nr:hypothetical protein [Sulfuricellaceae bacterium]
MQVTIKIKGREALPIRSIPYVTPWKNPPDSIVRTLAAPKTIKLGNNLVVPDRYNELFAYLADGQDGYEMVSFPRKIVFQR